MLWLTKIVAAGAASTCTPVAVWDGDGPIWCAEGPRIRISGIAAREMDGACEQGHPCPAASALATRDALVSILGGPRGTVATGHVKVRASPMQCRSTGSAGGNRTGAWCTLSGERDLSCAMLATRTVARWQRYWGNHRC